MLKGIEGVSTYAHDVDVAFIVVTVITLFLFIVTIGSMFYFAYRYQASKHSVNETKNIKHYTPIEVAWTVIPTILMMIVFYFGLDSLRVQRTMPKDDDAIIVKVLAQRWSWQFEYENGKKSNHLTIPENANIKLVMTAPPQDVLHSFFVPAFRAKEDIIPGQTTYVWFNATQKGKYDILCAEYCGTRHSYMTSHVNVVSSDDYTAFLAPEKKEKNAVDLLNDYGCTACHSLDGSALVGPTFKDNYNQEVTVVTNGKTRTIKKDDTYLRNAILEPNKDIVEGYASNMMPSFQGQISNKELDTIINYFKAEEPLDNTAPNKLNGLEIIQNNGCIGCHSIDGSKIVGPTFKNIYNRKTTIQSNGKTKVIEANEAYLKDAILQPNIEVVKGYQNIMPGFEGILNEDEINAIIEYLKELK